MCMGVCMCMGWPVLLVLPHVNITTHMITKPPVYIVLPHGVFDGASRSIGKHRHAAHLGH